MAHMNKNNQVKYGMLAVASLSAILIASIFAVGTYHGTAQAQGSSNMTNMTGGASNMTGTMGSSSGGGGGSSGGGGGSSGGGSDAGMSGGG
jgi:hypothetical protein